MVFRLDYGRLVSATAFFFIRVLSKNVDLVKKSE